MVNVLKYRMPFAQLMELLAHFDLSDKMLVVEHNAAILHKEDHAGARLRKGTKLKSFISLEEDKHMLKIGPYEFRSRLLLGTGKFPDFQIQKQAVDIRSHKF